MVHKRHFDLSIHHSFELFVLAVLIAILTEPISCNSCLPNQFQCKKTKNCITNLLRCDGKYNCGWNDNSDEENCDSCVQNAFQCNITLKCIPNQNRCDGRLDCGDQDASDEDDCGTCLPTAFQCNTTNNCVWFEKRCDGTNDCGEEDFSDEENCDTCLPNEFRCNITKICIPNAYRCDGVYLNCGHLEFGDYSDEENCDLCSTNEFQCNTTKRCIPISYRCDADLDCGSWDTSDEDNCAFCSTQNFQCKNSKRCLGSDSRCDGKYDCGENDHSDEDNCDICLNGFHCNITKNCIPQEDKCDAWWDCGEGDKSDELNCDSCPQFHCETSKTCIRNVYRCNGVYNCGDEDHSDEENCLICAGDILSCTKSKKCIPLSVRCNNISDCGSDDNSDETNCPPCSANEFQCRTYNECIPIEKRCDGFIHCGDDSDEENCEDCKGHLFRCANGRCIDNRATCSNSDLCGDNSENINCISTELCEDGTEFRCRNGKCIPVASLCNGEFDCEDKFDELRCSRELCSGLWCAGSSKCLSTSTRCDLKYDCNDEADESNCPAALELSANVTLATAELSDKADWSFFILSNSKFISFKMINTQENEIIFGEGKYKIVTSQHSPFLYETNIEIGNITWEDEGYYPLEVRIDGLNESKDLSLQLVVKDSGYPEFTFTNLVNTTITLTQGQTFDLVCNVTGHPKTKVTWVWNNISSVDWPSTLEYSMYQGDQILQLRTISTESQGRFFCIAENSIGISLAYADIVVLDKVNELLMIMGPIGGILGSLLIFVIFLVIRYKWKQRKLYGIISEMLQDKHEGLPMELSQWEIPRKNLDLGDIIGSGAFGVIFKAEVYGLGKDVGTTTVAVKTVKGNAEKFHFIALITELKVLAQLGNHPNIVGLLGACTINLRKKMELLIILEYCANGSLLDYIVENRNLFINQLNPVTNEIDPIINTQDGNICEKLSDGNCFDSTDLIHWSCHVAKAMEFISLKNVIHGDLAARNVLLAENKVAKICDFGYAKETIERADYKKDNGILFPIKWMAVESIFSGVFSSKSDCWSYGVFLWELFTLGMKPYQDIEINDEFRERIYQGYRMEKPEFAPATVYHVITDCWNHHATERPTFTAILESLEDIITNVEQKRVCALNDAYTHL